MCVLGDGRRQIMCQSSAHMLGDRETSMNQIEFLSFRAYGLSFQVLTQGKNKMLWENSSESRDLKCGPRMVEINKCAWYTSHKN